MDGGESDHSRQMPAHGLNDYRTDRGVEAQVADVTGDDGFLLGWCHAESVAYDGLLHRVHLHGETKAQEGVVVIFVVIFQLFFSVHFNKPGFKYNFDLIFKFNVVSIYFSKSFY